MASNLGTVVLLKVATKLLVGQSSLSYSKAATMIETSSKTTGDHSTFVSGRISSTMAVGGIASTSKEATAAGYWELNDAIEAGVPITVTFVEYTAENGTTAVVGAEQISVSALVSNLSWEAPDNDKITFSCDLQCTGAPTRSTIAGT